MSAAQEQLLRIAPELVLSAFGTVLMLMEPFVVRARRALPVVATLGAALALVATLYPARHQGLAFGGLLRIDGFSVFVHLIVEGVTLLVILSSAAYLEREHIEHGEYYALILFATVGMGVMASAAELMTAFIGLEVSSISTYILASYRRDSPRSNEAAMKYFLLGSFATAFFLYGIALVYGATGSTELARIAEVGAASSSRLLQLGLALLLVGLAFKVAAVPFQLWTPDVYEGAPAPVTALMACGPKAAAFALLLRITATVATAGSFWFWALWVSAVLTMFAGNLAAVAQSSVKRMLAYSSVAHAGYILVALTAVAAGETALGVAAVLYYLATYALMKMGAFLLLGQLSGPSERHMEMEDFYGLAARQPVAAACMALFMLSLLGLPISAGFLGKFYIFDAALASHLVWLAVFLAVNTVIGAYYYLRVIVVIYMREPSDTTVAAARVPAALTFVLLIAAAGTIYLGLFPGKVMAFAMQAAAKLL